MGTDGQRKKGEGGRGSEGGGGGGGGGVVWRKAYGQRQNLTTVVTIISIQFIRLVFTNSNKTIFARERCKQLQRLIFSRPALLFKKFTHTFKTYLHATNEYIQQFVPTGVTASFSMYCERINVDYMPLICLIVFI